MTGRDVIATERFGFAPKIAELELLIAHYAGIRSAAGLILARKIVDHGPFKLIGFVDHIMRKA